MSRPTRTEFPSPLTVVAIAAVLRLAYLVAQPSFDPAFAAPELDGAVYLDWARSLLEGGGSPAGAYYLAPGYAFALAAALGATQGSLFAVYALQHAAALAAAVVLGRLAGRLAGPRAAWIATAVAALYHPAMFFASRPSAEAFSLLPLAAAVSLMCRTGTWSAAGSGGLIGVAAMFRPAYLIVAVVWGACLALVRRPRAAVAAVAACAAVLAPVALRNLSASGHVVPVSSNGGITLYQGNAPGALGVFTPVEGLSGRIATQRDEATALAVRLSGTRLDDVQADLWWSRRALATRAAVPLDTAILLVRRVSLTLSSREAGLDAHPALDPYPWRLAGPLPFAIVFGLALAGAAGAGSRRSGSWPVWGAIAGCAATPILFYVSSRYRLPMAFLLSVPAGVGAAWILDGENLRRRLAIAAAGIAIGVLVPSFDLPRQTAATALANRSSTWRAQGRLDRAVRDAERAVARDPEDPRSRHALGAARGATGDLVGAEEALRAAIALDPANPGAAADLGGILVRAGRPAEAVGILQAAVNRDPEDRVAWTNLVVALAELGSPEAAREAARRARDRGVSVDPALLSAISEGADAVPQ